VTGLCRNVVVLNDEPIRHSRADISTLLRTINRLINSMPCLYSSLPYIDFNFLSFPFFCYLTTLYCDTTVNEYGAVSGMRIGGGNRNT
jgi:hypothetical protein